MTSETAGFAPVIPPDLSTGKTVCAMKTFQAWPVWLLGSTLLFEPYQTASARPGPPALTHGKTLTASPVPAEPSLTWTGFVHFVQPVAAERRSTNTCHRLGVSPEIAQATNRFRPASIEATVNSVSGEPGRLSDVNQLGAVRSPARSGRASRKVRLPLASGVPMFRSRSSVPFDCGKPAAWNTFPVRWSIAGYPSGPNGL